MNLFIMLAIIIANGIAFTIIYQFVKRMPKMEKIIFIGTSVAINYILILVTYALSGIGMNSAIHESSKAYITYVFVPVNLILFVPFFARIYIKQKDKKIKAEQLIKKAAILCIAALVILIIEFFYFKNVQQDIQALGIEKEKQEQKQTIQKQPPSNTMENENIAITNEQANEVRNQVEGNAVVRNKQ